MLASTEACDRIAMIYAEIKTAKDASPVPVFSNGHPAHSLYNPIREAEKCVSTLSAACNFFVLIGLGAGYAAEIILRKNKNAKIIAVEESTCDIEFLKKIPRVQKLLSENISRIFLVPTEKLFDEVKKKYLPAVYGDMEISVLQSWAYENQNGLENARAVLKNALKDIAADYSVQSHFGKIWQRNIINNFKFLSEAETSKNTRQMNVPASAHDLHLPTEKIAFVAAAGPTLDDAIDILRQNRKNYFIISTDTAYSALCACGISSDVVVSIDAQNVSHNHFMLHGKKRPLFVLDASCPVCISQKCANDGEILLVCGGHPLAQYYARYTKNMTQLFSGTGTVTIAAVDFALKAGFTRIEVAGADFAYVNGKSYAHGTYLDALYYANASRIHTVETQYDTLLFRTPLVKKNDDVRGNIATTSVLESYRKSFEKFLSSVDMNLSYDGKIYHCVSKNLHTENHSRNIQKTDAVDFAHFKKNILRDIEKEISDLHYKKSLFDSISPIAVSVLPYVAYLRSRYQQHRHQIDNNFDFHSLLELAYKSLILYTK